VSSHHITGDGWLATHFISTLVNRIFLLLSKHVSSFHSFNGVGVNLVVGSDGSSLGGSESANGGSELDSGHA